VQVVVVYQHFLAAGEPGLGRFNEMTRVWLEAGHAVTVIAGTVNYQTGSTARTHKTGLLHRERDGGLDVWRCFVPGTYSRSYAGRKLAYAIFTLTACYAALRSPRADIVIASSPPLVVVVPGWLKAKVSGLRTPWIVEVRDLWPESAVTTGIVARASAMTRLLFLLEAWAYRSARRIAALTPGIKADIVRRKLAPAEKIVEIPNGADLRRFVPGARDNSFRSKFGWGDRCVAIYAGAHGKANALDQLVEAATILRERDDIVFALVGDGPERPRLERTARDRKLTNITFCGPQPRERMPECINASDIAIAVVQANPTFLTVYPNKIFEYMACARPIVLAVDGVARELVCHESRSGLFVHPGDASGIATSVRQLADEPALRTELGQNGRRWVEQNESRDALAQRYLTVMEELLGR
jgi:glycosyltransferase involved in cell wall biosynthesis